MLLTSFKQTMAESLPIRKKQSAFIRLTACAQNCILPISLFAREHLGTMAKWSVVTATIRNDSTITLVFTPTKICKSRWSGICIAPITFRWLFLDGNLPIKSSGKWKPLDFSDFSRATPSLRQKNQFSIDKTLSLFPVSHHWQTNKEKNRHGANVALQ